MENEVVQRLIQIQQMLPEGVKYWSYQGIYDPNDEIDIPSEYKNNSTVTGTIWNDNDDGVYVQTGHSVDDDDRVYGKIYR